MNLFQILAVRRARVLFVCVGNSCRSQVAEAYARVLASDIIEPASAGMQPSSRISRTTRAVMQARGVPFAPSQTPKGIVHFDLDSFDLIVNLCQYALPNTKTPVLKMHIHGPVRQPKEAHHEVCDEIGQLVHGLADHFRYAKEWNVANPLYSEECALASASH